MEQILGHRDLVEFFVKLLDKYKINYLLTGSFAVSYYGHPRATHDIDFIVEIKKKGSAKILEAIKELGTNFVVDASQIKEAVLNSLEFNILHTQTGIKLDFWIVEKNEFEQNKFKRKKAIFIDKQKINLISAEDLILTKLLWCKTLKSERHLQDCVGILEVQKNKLDKVYLDKCINKLELEELFKEISTQEYY